MKKIIIALIMVFMCGVLAFTIPKNASASSIDIYDDDYSVKDFETMKDGDYWYVYGSIVDHIYYYEDLFISVYGVQYAYTKTSTNGIVIQDLKYLYRFGKIGTSGDEFSISFDNRLNTGIRTAEDMLLFGNGKALPFTLPLILEIYLYVNHREGQNVAYDISVYGYLDFTSTGFGTWYAEENEYILISYPNYDDYEIVTSALHYQPTLLLYVELYGRSLMPMVIERPVYIDEDVDFFEYIKNTTSNFLETNIIGELSFGDILLFVVSIGLLVFILRFFAGG